MRIEKSFSKDTKQLSVGIANINSIGGELEKNKRKITDALDFFLQKAVNLVIFPEYCLSGYFWEPENECLKYINQKVCLSHQAAWFDEIAKSYTNETLQYIIFNGLKKDTATPEKFCNTTFIIDNKKDYWKENKTYKKNFLFELEKKHLVSGNGDSLILETLWGKFGFLTCYDICFPYFIQELVSENNLDGLIVNAAWRKHGNREYPGLSITQNSYYQMQWNIILPSIACQNQVWVLAANAVGPHSIKDLDYCGESGIWAPSGIQLLKASDYREELLILQNIDIFQEVQSERKTYSYIDDLKNRY